MVDLFPDWTAKHAPKKAKPPSSGSKYDTPRKQNKPIRTQYRRSEWEDAADPALYAYSLFGEPSATDTPPGPDKVAILAARHENRQRLWGPWDKGAKPKDVDDVLGQIMKENASGIEELPSNVERVNPYRAHPWDGTRHVHLGYHAKWENACFAVRLWHACCGTTDDDGIDCAKWTPQGDWTDEILARLTEADIERIARARRF